MPQLTIVVVTGDLGAGKTRLINALAAQAEVSVAAVVHGIGPVSLDALWLPERQVVSLDAGCGCCGEESELADALILLHAEEGVELALVELAADQDLGGALCGIAELLEAEEGEDPADVAELIVVDAGAVPESLLGEYGLLSALRDEHAMAPDSLPGHDHDREHGAGCSCGHDGHAGGACHDSDRRSEPQWMPFWYAGAVDEDALCEALGRLPATVTRVKAAMEVDPDTWVLVDRVGDDVTQLTISRDELPALYDLESLAEQSPLDPVPPDGGALVLCWCHAPDEEASVALEWEIGEVLDQCFGAETDPDEAAAYALETLDDPDRILEVLSAARAAASATPGAADRLELLAKAYHSLAENEHALVLLREAARVEPSHRSCRLNAARVHLSYEENDVARELAEGVLADYPDDAETRAVLGEALVVEGELEAGLPHLEAAAAATPEDDLIRAMLSNVLAEAGELERALAYSDEVVALDPEDAGSWYFRGVLLLRLGRPDEARDALEEALLKGNENPWVMTALGIVAYLQERDADTVELFNEALGLAEAELEEDPSASSVLDLLLAYAFTGNLDAGHDLLGDLDSVAPDELASARELLALAPGCGHAAGLLVAIDGIIVAEEG